MRIEFLRSQADEHDQPDLAVDVVGQAARRLRQQRPEQRERHRQQHDERQHQALVLRGQHQDRRDDAQAENERRTGCPRCSSSRAMPLHA